MKRTKFGVAIAAVLIALAGCSAKDDAKDLKFGETIDVDAYDNGKVGIGITSIETGSNADLSTLENAAKYTGKTPYYVHYVVVKRVGDKHAKGDFAAYAGDSQLTRLSVQSRLDLSDRGNVKRQVFDKCNSDAFLNEVTVGQRIETCMIFLADPGTARPTKIEYIVDRKTTLARWS
ncbi:hypothetical protein [Nocardia inohanensis]|uniref:hypothetical protein n=1 Tax=Nocardia inohanensis TaxID=209246 RepID=UPI00082FD43F|nr:hypothetical protein [Nocardia inohanensis]